MSLSSSIPPPMTPSPLERTILAMREDFFEMGGYECACGGAVYPDGLAHRRTCSCGPGAPLTETDVARIWAEWRRRR